MALSPIQIPALQAGRPIVTREGAPQTDFQTWINSAFRQLQSAQNATNAALVAAGLATAAAAAANAAADAASSETSIVNSFVTGFVGTSPLSADNTGLITVANHQRQYGDPTLNPTVNVTGDTFASGASVGDIVRVFYDDPTRAGGGVTYQFTIDPVDPPVQGGDRHVVGAVEIPAAGSSDGGYVRPPGYTNPIP